MSTTVHTNLCICDKFLLRCASAANSGVCNKETGYYRYFKTSFTAKVPDALFSKRRSNYRHANTHFNLYKYRNSLRLRMHTRADMYMHFYISQTIKLTKFRIRV